MAISKAERMKRRRRKKIATIILAVFILIVIGLMCYGVAMLFSKNPGVGMKRDGMYFTVNGHSRTGTPLNPIKIQIKKSSLCNADSVEIRNAYERADLLNAYDSTPIEGGIHYAVGVDGGTTECIPTNEVAPGYTGAIVIEYSADENGSITQETKATLDKLVSDLSSQYSITEKPIYED